MTAGALYGAVQGTLMISVAATVACTLSFLIARYFARDRAVELAGKYNIFNAIDAAVSKDGLKIVALLRFSPLLPFAVANYLYGLTAVSIQDYMIGSWIGMLPGCTWYVLAGSIGASTWTSGGELDVASQAGSVGLALGFAASLSAGGYAAKLIQDSLKEVEAEAEQAGSGDR
ncbi:hypothetical protein CYMTET_50105 [Cymbomonas tetramitiformis]|uniref:VTT domain-containing protein n=1 Tax=Cymbomonas tetramitiformis TaxID=36881 RepID=A0AAE0ET69_9CHLO|nr:hypothetical protein CYMTET_50105 [Cymbomonas tetramitiformis]